MIGIYNNPQECVLDEAAKFFEMLAADKDMTGLFTRKDEQQLAAWFWLMKMEIAKIEALY